MKLKINILRIAVSLFLSTFVFNAPLSGQTSDTTFYLLTCAPGTETYSIYGHSALRMTIISEKTDTVYNWGVFDFSTPNFAWKFAKGRLNYMLDTDRFGRFLQIYFYEKRYVLSQKINLEPAEKRKISALIAENLRPENIKYRYDFFYDDCSTRIRDLLEKATGSGLVYPQDPSDKVTFRDLIGKYQRPYPWLRWGVDLLVGSPADIMAGVRERMFLPIDMMEGLSETSVNRNGVLTPLMEAPETVLDFEPLTQKNSFLTSPLPVFSLLLLVVLALSYIIRKRIQADIMDMLLFTVFSLLAILLVFFNFFTEHNQTHWNFNIIWLNPLIPVCLGKLLAGKPGTTWFRSVFLITAVFLVGHFFIPQEFNPGIYPLVLIIFVRSYARSGFRWNPFPVNLREHQMGYNIN